MIFLILSQWEYPDSFLGCNLICLLLSSGIVSLSSPSSLAFRKCLPGLTFPLLGLNCSFYVHSVISNTFKSSPGPGAFEPTEQITLSGTWWRRMNLPALLFQVKRISEDPPCKCPNKFCVERLSQGRYRVGEKILFIRVKFYFSRDILSFMRLWGLEWGYRKVFPVSKQRVPLRWF